MKNTSEKNAKEIALKTIKSLPTDVTLDEILYQLYLLEIGKESREAILNETFFPEKKKKTEEEEWFFG
jgi:hypothetical protein